MTDTLQPPPPQLPRPEGRARRTHTSPQLIELFKKLTLSDKLKTNKKIDNANQERRLKSINHLMDPATYPESGSEEASLLTLASEDMKELQNPSIFDRLKDLLTDSLLSILTKDAPKKRGGDPLDSEETKRRRCLIGTKEAPARSMGIFRQVEFAKILYDTELHVAIPLNFFLNKNLRYIADHAAVLPLVKANPLDNSESGKGICILDVMKLSKPSAFGDELAMTCSEWAEAAENYHIFQQSRDAEGDQGRFSTWLFQHFQFFQKAEDRNDYYDAWKVLEQELRRQYRSNPEPFDTTAYFLLYLQAKTRFDMKVDLAKSSVAPPTFRGTRPPSSSLSPSQPSGSRPFRNGDKKSSSPPCCLICAERGHAISEHHGATKPVTFADGSQTWAQPQEHFIVSPTRQQVCIPFNIRGSGAGCSHSKEARLHACSFCGNASHHAFSWTCRARPLH